MQNGTRDADVSGSAEGPAYSAARLWSLGIMGVDGEFLVATLHRMPDLGSYRVDND